MNLDTINNLLWIVAIAESVGAIANVYKRWWCFIIWICTSVIWAAYSAYTHVWAQAAVWTLYIFITTIGLRKWYREERKSLKDAERPVVAMDRGEKDEADEKRSTDSS